LRRFFSTESRAESTPDEEAQLVALAGANYLAAIYENHHDLHQLTGLNSASGTRIELCTRGATHVH